LVECSVEVVGVFHGGDERERGRAFHVAQLARNGQRVARETLANKMKQVGLVVHRLETKRVKHIFEAMIQKENKNENKDTFVSAIAESDSTLMPTVLQRNLLFALTKFPTVKTTASTCFHRT
jgi:hypothetical protein